MRVIISLSAHEQIEQGTVVFKGRMDERDWYQLASLMFGPSLPSKEQIKAFDTPFGPVNIIRTGPNSAVWMHGDKRIDTLEVFDKITRPLPMRTPTHCGDFFMAVRARNHFQYLIRPFKKNELVWFDGPEQMDEYYNDRKIKPAYSRMNERKPSPSIMRSWSADEGEVFYDSDLDKSERDTTGA